MNCTLYRWILDSTGKQVRMEPGVADLGILDQMILTTTWKKYPDTVKVTTEIKVFGTTTEGVLWTKEKKLPTI